jgi:molybdenum cofactor cytidylyltransferase
LAGIGVLPKNAVGFLLAFADQPAVLPDTVRELVSGFLQMRGKSGAVGPAKARTPNLLALPVYRGKRGHPVVISSALIPAIRAIAPGDTLRTVVHQHLGSALLIPVEDSSVLDDLDTPEDFARVEAKVLGRGGV